MGTIVPYLVAFRKGKIDSDKLQQNGFEVLAGG